MGRAVDGRGPIALKIIDLEFAGDITAGAGEQVDTEAVTRERKTAKAEAHEGFRTRND